MLFYEFPTKSRCLHMVPRSIKTIIKLKWIILAIFLAFTITGSVGIYAAEAETEAASASWKYMAMAIAVGMGSIAGGYAVAKVGTAACAAAAERPELAGRLLIYLGLAEGVCIYGVLVALLVWIA